MFWKIIGIVALVWIAFALLGVLVKGLFWILAISAVVFGLYVLFKGKDRADGTDRTRF
ncbi:hypothetical protein [Prescottella subtropica]|uniref:hypothetical protein n=1 Tax=Prescottella subtropica TaxID=2545757 RepID=UPI00147876D7|nr:hypothetical protein [Prescottella subtropica]